MKNLFLYICLSFKLVLYAQNTPVGNVAPVGQWQTFINYNLAIDIAEAGHSTFIANNLGILEVRNEYEQIFHTKVTGLSDMGISKITYNKTHNVLIIAYNNANIDLLYYDNNTIKNISSILDNENIIGSKHINNIFTKGDKVYFSCDFGLVEYNLDTNVFGFTTFTGSNMVLSATADEYAIYIATDLGLYKGLLDGRNLQDINVWQLQGTDQGLPSNNYTSKTVLHDATLNKLYTELNDTLFNFNYTTQLWEHIPIVDLETQQAKPYLVLSGYNIERLQLNFKKEVLYLITNSTAFFSLNLANGELFKHYFNDDQTGNIYQVVTDSFNAMWLAGDNQIYSSRNSGIQPYSINSPANDNATDIIVDKRGWMWMASASLDYTTVYFDNAGFSRFNRENWKNFNATTQPLLAEFRDAVTLAVDPTTGDVFVGSFMDGIAHMRADSILAIYNKDNTNNGLQGVIGDEPRTRITAMEFDAKGNCWIANPLSTNPLVVRKKDGTWQNFSIPNSRMNLYEIAIDRNSYKWIAQSNGILVFDEGDMANPNDDRVITLTTQNSRLPSNRITAIKADRNGAIWVGTENGIIIFSCGNSVFEGACQGNRPIVTVDDFNSYVMHGEVINDIAVDGANQKWLATNNGVFLLSPDAYIREKYFTVENSPLPHNTVSTIAVDEVTGMVYMGTDKGVVGYRGDAIKAASYVDKNAAYAFPNPVPPEYTGQIAIKGLPQDANVKITDITGKLVHETKAFGGQAVWDAYDYTGRRTASGVYLVFAVSSDGQQKLATKIVFIK